MDKKYSALFHILKPWFNKLGNRGFPRSLVFVFDVIVVFVLFFAAYTIRLNFDLAQIPYPEVFYKVLFTTLVYGLFFLGHQTYSGIIRHTGFLDISNIFKATALAWITIMSSIALADLIGNRPHFSPPYSVLIIHFFLTLAFIVASRLIVRAVFIYMLKSIRRKQVRVVIYGAGKCGRTTRNALISDGQIDYKIIAFLDDNLSLDGKYLEGVAVMTPEKYLMKNGGSSKLSFERCPADLLVISIEGLSVERRRTFMEMALANQLTVKAVPPMNNWINGNLNLTQLRKLRIEELLERPKIELFNNELEREAQGNVIMITGAAGSIGSEIARQTLALKPSKLLLLDQNESGLFDLKFALNADPALSANSHLVELVVGSITDRQFLKEILSLHQPLIIYHAAAYKHVPLMEDNPYMAVMVNVFGTKNLADMALKCGCKKFVFISTDKAVNPSSIMGASKRIAEKYLQSQCKNSHFFITTRFGNVLDSNGSVSHIFQKQIDAGGPINVTHKDIFRYFMLIPEACSLVLEAASMGNGGEIFVFDMGEQIRIYDLARKMVQLNGLTPDVDIKIQITGLRPGEKLYEELLHDKESTIPTHHPKILKAIANGADRGTISNQLTELQRIANTFDKKAIVAKMMEIVEEYCPLNTVFADAKEPDFINESPTDNKTF